MWGSECGRYRYDQDLHVWTDAQGVAIRAPRHEAFVERWSGYSAHGRHRSRIPHNHDQGGGDHVFIAKHRGRGHSNRENRIFRDYSAGEWVKLLFAVRRASGALGTLDHQGPANPNRAPRQQLVSQSDAL